MKHATSQTRRRLTGRHGIALLLVLLTVSVLTLVIYAFTDRMMVEEAAARGATRQVQARQWAMSGTALAKVLFLEPFSGQASLGGTYDNLALFANRPISPSQQPSDDDVGYVALVAPAVDSSGNYFGTRFGLFDESAKFPINVALSDDRYSDEQIETGLLMLPGMTLDIVHALQDWVDRDDEPRPFGAEVAYYSGLAEPYAPRNGPFAAIEELLLVRGVTPGLLYGLDRNRNRMVDLNEAATMLGPEVDNSTGLMNLGWSAYLTTASNETLLRPDGEPKIDLNGSDLTTLAADLGQVLEPDQVTFILAYRQSGQYSGDESVVGEGIDGRTVSTTAEGGQQIDSLLDLVGTRVEARFDGVNEPVVVASPFGAEPAELAGYFPTLLDATYASAEQQPGRININQAPYPVLLAIPGITESQVMMILAQRIQDPATADPSYRHTAWLLSNQIVTLDEMRQLYPYITGGGSIYRTQSVGYGALGGAARIEFVIDATQMPPRLVGWKDMSSLGVGFDTAAWLSLDTFGLP